MRVLFFISVFLIGTLNAVGQTYDFPPKPETGKCYETCFEYDEKLTWKEISCDVLIEGRKQKPTKAEVLKTQKEDVKFRKYQEKLLNLGYDVNVNGVLDANTADAHHKYLKSKEKTSRKEKRALRKKSKTL